MKRKGGESLLENIIPIKNANKKGIYIYIREQTDQDTPQITKIMKRLEKVYKRLHNQYLDYGYVSLNY
jgi:hypothetical protein